MDQPAFDRVVEALIQRIHEGDPEVTVDVFDGRGGDQGRDIVVSRGDGVEVLYQLKCFPEGFSGAWGKSRKPQIRRSFTAAMAHSPARWVLVMPRNPTSGEKRFVRSLKGKSSVEVGVMGRAQLDSAIAARPDLLDAFTRDPLVATLKEIGQEHRGLVRPQDLDATLDDLSRRIDGRSAYWGTTVTVTRHGTLQELFAKHPRAAELEPINISFMTANDRLDSVTQERLTAFLEYGSGEKVIVPADAVQSFEVTGPEWIARKDSGVQVEFHSSPPSPEDGHQVELRIVDENEATVASLRGEAVGKGIGQIGVSLRAAFPGGLELDFRFPNDLRASGEVKIKHELVGADALAVNRALRFQNVLSTPQTLQVWVDGWRLATLRSQGGGERPGPSDYARMLVEDLAVISVALDVPLIVPAEVTAAERAEVRSCRLLLDGFCILVPEVGGMQMTLNGTTSPAIEQFLNGNACMIRTEGGLAYSVQGHQLAIRDAHLFHPTVRVVDGDPALKALQVGTAEGMTIHVQPTDGTPFRAYLPNKITDPAEPLVPTPLGVTGLDEHPAIMKILDAVRESRATRPNGT